MSDESPHMPGLGNLVGVFTSVTDFAASQHPIRVLAARDGYYQYRENEIGIFGAKVPEVEVLPVGVQALKLKVPPIPYEILAEIVAFFRALAFQEVPLEAMVQVLHNRAVGGYAVVVPLQTVGTASVDAELDPKVLENYVQVMQVHSHNFMSAKFSATDDADEQATMLYAVIGRLDKLFPDIRVRYAVGGHHVEIPPATVFDMPESHFPESWLKQIVRPRPMVEGDEFL